MALEQILHRMGELASEWEQDVSKRREVTMHDYVADVRAFDARQLRELAAELAVKLREVTPKEYATLWTVSAPTVTAWCRTGKLKARRKGKGWLIPSDAPPPKFKRRRSTASKPR